MVCSNFSSSLISTHPPGQANDVQYQLDMPRKEIVTGVGWSQYLGVFTENS